MGVRSLSYLAAQTFIDEEYPKLARVYELEGEPAVKAVITIAEFIQNGIFFDSRKSKLLGDDFQLPENITLKQITREQKIFIKKAIVAITKGEPFFISSYLLGIFGYIFASRGEDNIHVIFKTGPTMSASYKDVFPALDVLSGLKMAMVCPRVKRLGSHINARELSLLQEMTLTPQGRGILPEIYFIKRNGLTVHGENLIMVQALGYEDLRSYLARMNTKERFKELVQCPSRLKLEFKTRLSIGIQLLKILDILKQLNIVHRDIKSSNLINIDGGNEGNKSPDIKLIDLGFGVNLDRTSEDSILDPTYNMAPEMAVIALRNQNLKERFRGLRCLQHDLKIENKSIFAELELGENICHSQKKEMQNKSRFNEEEIQRCNIQIKNILKEQEELFAQWRKKMCFSYDVWHCAYIIYKLFKPWISNEFQAFHYKFFRKGLHPCGPGAHRASALKMTRLIRNRRLSEEFSSFVPNEGIEEIIKAMLKIDASERLSAGQAMRGFQFLRKYWFPPESAAGAVGSEEEEALGGAGAARA